MVRRSFFWRNKKAPSREALLSAFRVPARARTVDPLIKSQLLYQLSYRDIFSDCKDKNCDGLKKNIFSDFWVMATIHVLIKGRVQGVFFRVSAKEQADRLGVRGWVRNTRDGHVEIVATGADTALQQFVDWCRHGPPRAGVAEVIEAPHPETSFRDFSIARE